MHRCSSLLFAICICSASAQDFTDLKVERIVSGLMFADGLAWSPANYLMFSDVPRNKLMKLAPGEKVELYRDNSNGANGNAFDAQGRLYTCEGRGRRVIRTDKKGKIEVLATQWNGKKLNAPNDIALRKDGDAYFTDPAFGYQQDARDLDFYGVYHITRKGELDVIAKLRTRPNGIAVSPNGRTLYVSNSDERNIRAYDLDRNGAASNDRVLVSAIDGVPDGLRVDDKGNLYLAANAIAVYSAEGKLLGSIPFNEKPSSCGFGDADLQGLYVASRTSLYRIRWNVKGSAPW